MRSIDLTALARRAMRERGLEPDFPAAALAQAERLRAPAVSNGTVDLRDLPWCSIDNDDSRDLDQLTVTDRDKDGAVHVLVAIADVDALVPIDTPLDAHARVNTTSVYTPARVFPMLPERLSTDLTSLNPDQDRVAIVISFTVGSDDRPANGAVLRARVRNRARLAYDSVAAWLDGHGPIPDAMADGGGVAAQIRRQDELAERLRRRRHQQGALDLEGDGITRRGGRRPRRRSPDGVEEPREGPDRGLHDRGQRSDGEVPRSQRATLDPARGSIAEAMGPAAVAGRGAWRSPAGCPDPKALAGFLARRRKEDPLRYSDVSLSVVKLLGAASTSLTRSHDEEARHFGLAVTEYVHSTAPNRRYPDLITQRLLKAAIDRGARPTPTRNWTAWPATAPGRKTPPKRSSGRCASPRPLFSCHRGSGSTSTRS